MNKIVNQAKRGWILKINGEVVPVVEHLCLVNSRFGELEYGLTPGGWDAWQFHENGGGGSVIIPYAKISGQLFVGLVHQSRPNQGGDVWNIPRGFLQFGETHFGTAQSELEQEVGYRSLELRLLEGKPMNANSAFFVTQNDEGVRVYALEVHDNEIIDGGTNGWSFNPKVLRPISKSAELIFGCRFFPWRQATEVGDMFTLAAIARLQAALE